jgi:hypothetical protein
MKNNTHQHSALVSGLKVGLVCLTALLVACGGGTPTSSVPAITADSKVSSDTLVSWAKSQAETQLRTSFGTLDHKDTINSQQLWVYTNSETPNDSKTYLTISIQNGNEIGWSATKITDGVLQTMGFQAPENGLGTQSIGGENVDLVTIQKKLKDIILPKGVKFHIKRVDAPNTSDINPQSTSCSHCVSYFVVEGHYNELTVWDYIAAGAAGGAASIPCSGAGPVVSGGCFAAGAWVARTVLSWVPGYSYCTQWEGLGTVCPTSYRKFSNEILADRRNSIYETKYNFVFQS